MSIAKPFNHDTYNIEHPTGSCAATGNKLEPGDPYIATLITSPPPKADVGAGSSNDPQKPSNTTKQTTKFPLFQRVDVSAEAWENGHRPDHLFSFWRSIVPEPNRKQRLFVDDQVLLDLFTRLADTDDPQKLAFRFVLALILMRKKRLRYNGSLQKTDPNSQPQQWWRLTPMRARGQQRLTHDTPPNTDTDTDNDQPTEYELFNPQLDQTQIQQVADQLGEILDVEL